jgi:glycosyltransferase involved in cell wall biosynthesis
MGEVESLPVGTVAERFNGADAREAQIEQFLFCGQGRNLSGKLHYTEGLLSLSIVIPAYNEERRLPQTLDRIREFIERREFHFAEIIIVDDGSRDRTAGVVSEAAQGDTRIRLVSNPGNRGKGYAVRHGMQEARGDWILMTDADLSAPIDEFDKLWAAVRKQNSDGAIGSRAIDRSLIGVRQSVFREFSGKVFNFVMRLIAGLPYRDTQCGFKLLSRAASQCVSARQLSDGFGFDVEMLYIAKKHKFRIVEVPVRWNNVEGTKVSLWNGVAAFADPLRVRLNDFKGLYR